MGVGDQDAMFAHAREQEWLVTYEELIGFRYTKGAIEHQVDSRRLWPAYRGVFAVGYPELPPARRALAAVLSCGDGAGLALRWAARHRRIWEGPVPLHPQVAAPNNNGRTGPLGVDLMRPSTLKPEDIERFNGIAVTTAFRTICDNAATLSRVDLKSMVRQAARTGGMDVDELRAYVEDHPRSSWRHSRVRKVLDLYLPAEAMTQTEREARFMDLCRKYAIPLPRPQYEIGIYVADFAWPELKLIVEIDDRSHVGLVATADDRRRDRAMAAAGYETLHFMLAELQREPKLVAAETRAACARRAELQLRRG